MVKFPDEDLLIEWINLIERKGNALLPYLPLIDRLWFQEMISCVEITAIASSQVHQLDSIGAKLFYKISKNHRRIDGNKRSALLVTVLLFILNDYFLEMAPVEMYDFATWVADSDAKKQELIEEKIKEVFHKHLKTLPAEGE